jgi:PAS domain S-box-containing protein
VHDLQGHLLAVNPGPARVLGYSVEEVLKIPMRDMIVPEFRAQFDGYLREVTEKGEASGVMAVLTRSGERRYWEYHNTLRTEGVKAPVIRGIAHDVTERIVAEQRLREANRILQEQKSRQESLLSGLQLFRTLLDQSNDAIEVVDPKTMSLMDVNQRTCTELGYSRDEILKMTVFDIDSEMTPDSMERVTRQLEAEGTLTLESVHRRKDGSTFPVEISLKRVQLERPYVVAVSRDITERRRRDERLREFERVVESLDEMICVVNREYRYVLANRAFLRRRCMTRDQIVGRLVEEVVGCDLFRQVVKPKLDECFIGNVVSYEHRTNYPHLGERELFVTYLPVEGPHGIDRAAAVLRDVTEQKRSADMLQESERRFRAVHDRAPVGVALVDSRSGRFLQVNPKFCQIAGRTEAEMLALTCPDITHPDDVEGSTKHLREMVEKGGTLEIEKRFVRPNGEVVRVTLSLVSMWEPGHPAHWHMAIAQDITERRNAEDALRSSEERMRLAQEAACIGVFERNMQSGGCRWSPEMEAIYGLPPGSAPQSIDALLELIHPDDRELVLQLVAESRETGSAGGEWRTVWPDGSLHWISGRWRMFKDDQGNAVRALGVDIDITERKRIEEALRTGEADLRDAQRVAQMGSWSFDLKTQTVRASEQLFRVTGMEPMPGGIPFDELKRFFPDETWQRIVTGARKAAETGQTEDLEIAFRRADGTGGWLLARSKVIKAEDGNIVAVSGVAMDITDRRRAEEELENSERRFRAVYERSPVGMCIVDSKNGRFLQVNEKMREITGRSEADLTNRDFLSITHPDDVPENCEQAQKFAAGETDHLELMKRYVRPDGSLRWVQATAVHLPGNRDLSIGIVQDVTELRLAKEKLAEEKLYLEQEISTVLGFEEIVGQNAGLREVMEKVRKVASSNATVLLLGETGTGKELVARALHRLSGRADSSFIKMNCAAIPSGLLESELFGHEKGAFTGSVARKIGRLELADKGTLFLDEIGEVSLNLQPKLLRVLQDMEFERLGGTQTIKVDFRLIAATNRDLAESVQDNEFRRDLYYRLNVFPIRLPALRERRDDIPMLVEHFVQKCSRRLNKHITSIPRKTMNALVQWDWLGNIRELENFIERSVILTQGSVLAAPLSELQASSAENGQLETLADAERQHILRALRDSQGLISGPRGAAARLGLKRTTLQSKLKNMGINPRVPPTAL